MLPLFLNYKQSWGRSESRLASQLLAWLSVLLVHCMGYSVIALHSICKPMLSFSWGERKKKTGLPRFIVFHRCCIFTNWRQDIPTAKKKMRTRFIVILALLQRSGTKPQYLQGVPVVRREKTQNWKDLRHFSITCPFFSPSSQNISSNTLYIYF